MRFDNMFHSKTKRQLARIHEVIHTHSKGIYKRIDENRELMELLARDHGPGFLERNPWVAGWLESQDDFLNALKDADGLPVAKPGSSSEGYPRPAYNAFSERNGAAIPQISAVEICQRFEENRTLIDALPRLAPDGFMRENRWIDGLLHWQSDFISNVAAVFGVPLPQIPSDYHYHSCPVQNADIHRNVDIDSQDMVIHATSEANEQEELKDRARKLSCKILYMIRSIAIGGRRPNAFSLRAIPDRERLNLIFALADVGDNLPYVGTLPVWFDKQEIENVNAVTEFIATRQEVPDGFHMLTKGANKPHDEVVSGTNIFPDEKKDNALTVEVAREKRKQVDAIASACVQSDKAIRGPRFHFAAGGGSTAFLVVLVLMWMTRLPGWSVFLWSFIACISVFILTYQFSTRPLEWGELIDKRLAEYDPIDKEAYRYLQKDIDEKGCMDTWKIRKWIQVEREAIMRVYHDSLGLTGSEFLRKVV